MLSAINFAYSVKIPPFQKDLLAPAKALCSHFTAFKWRGIQCASGGVGVAVHVLMNSRKCPGYSPRFCFCYHWQRTS